MNGDALANMFTTPGSSLVSSQRMQGRLRSIQEAAVGLKKPASVVTGAYRLTPVLLEGEQLPKLVSTVQPHLL